MEEPRRFTYSSCAVSLVLGAILALIAAFWLPVGPFLIGKAFPVVLIVPDKLGFVDHVAPEETIVLTRDGEHAVVLSRKGEYRIQSQQDLSVAWISLTPKGSNYETWAAPIEEHEYMFYVEAAGPYTIHIDIPGVRYGVAAEQLASTLGPEGANEVQFVITPYVGAYNARIALISGAIHIAVVAMLARFIFRIANRKSEQQELATQADKRDRLEGFIDDLRQSKSQSKLRK